MPNNHKTPGRQEAGQAIGAEGHCSTDRTNRLGIITIITHGKQMVTLGQALTQDILTRLSDGMGPLQDTNTRRNHPRASW